MIFENHKGNKFDIDQIVEYIKATFKKHPYEVFRIIIGTDSQKKAVVLILLVPLSYTG